MGVGCGKEKKTEEMLCATELTGLLEFAATCTMPAHMVMNKRKRLKDCMPFTVLITHQGTFKNGKGNIAGSLLVVPAPQHQRDPATMADNDQE